MQKLLVSVRGKKEAIKASNAGADILDVEYPGSALGTPYPLNIFCVRESIPLDKLVSANIGEEQHVWSTAAQAAVGIAYAGADIIKVGLAGLSSDKALIVMQRAVHHIKYWFPWKKLISVFFVDFKFRKIVEPVLEGPCISKKAKAQGVLIDTYDKALGKGLLDYLTIKDIRKFVKVCERVGQESWIAGSIKLEQMSALWQTGVDVICVRAAACRNGISDSNRFNEIEKQLVSKLVLTKTKGGAG